MCIVCITCKRGKPYDLFWRRFSAAEMSDANISERSRSFLRMSGSRRSHYIRISHWFLEWIIHRIKSIPYFSFIGRCSGSGVLGGWFFGSPSSPDSNFLRVANAFPNRRLSDNTLMTPKIRIASSCASSPGGTPSGGLPIRRHSSIGPQERRGSAMNLSPPTVRISICQCINLYEFIWFRRKGRRWTNQKKSTLRNKHWTHSQLSSRFFCIFFFQTSFK